MTAPTTPSPERQPADAGGGLLPCPWCGGEGWLNDYEARWGDMPPKSRCPQCRSCGANLGYRPTPAKAIAAWNRRSPAPQAQPDARSIFSEDVGTRFLQERLVELAAMFGVPDGGRYLNDWKARADQITQALSAHAVDGGWRPIESAPKDGTKVLTWGCLHDDGGVDMGETPSIQISEMTKFGWSCPLLGGHYPTHWRPLPAPPVPLHPAAPTDEVGKS